MLAWPPSCLAFAFRFDLPFLPFLLRSLAAQAVLDPTAIEMETRRQMAERQQAHEDRNLARALTPAERRDKKLRKMFDDTGA